MSRRRILTAMVSVAVGLLFCKVLVEILAEYRWYFPADFDHSAFLGGRRFTFVGTYRTAFYAHILSGPLAVVLGVVLMLLGGKSRYRVLHRLAGKLQMVNVLAVLVPSGLVMARQAYAGPIAALGFSALSIATGACAVAAIHSAVRRKFQLHQRWATRCFILLISPLILRLASGGIILLGLESDWTYRLNAWLSWVIPLAIGEVWWWTGSIRRTPATVLHRAADEVQVCPAPFSPIPIPARIQRARIQGVTLHS